MARKAEDNAMTEINEITRGIQCNTCGVVNWPTALCCMRCNAALDKRLLQAAPSYRVGGDMTFSQSLARFFEIVDYVLLAPASYGMLMLLAFLPRSPLFPLAVAAWFTIGCFLLSGFFRHSRGRLKDSQVSLLWWATIAYNMVDLTIMWVIARQDTNSAFFYFGLWPLLVVVFSAMALTSESRRSKTPSYN